MPAADPTNTSASIVGDRPHSRECGPDVPLGDVSKVEQFVSPCSSRGAAPIFVTGGHRFGTTWVGRMLALAPKAIYVDEPFRPREVSDVLAYRTRFPDFFTLVDSSNADRFQPVFDEVFRHRPVIRPLRELMQSPKHLKVQGKRFMKHVLGRTLGWRPVVKDPNALFSTPWLSDRYGTANVVMMRHPAAFAGSLKRMNWSTDFGEFLSQDRLMESAVGRLAADMRSTSRDDVIGQSIVLWNMFADWIGELAKRPDVQVIIHERLSVDPLSEFRRLYQWLGLEFTDKVESRIREHTAGKSAEAPVGEWLAMRRDSAGSVQTWKTRLSEVEQARIRRGTEAQASRYYDASTWTV